MAKPTIHVRLGYEEKEFYVTYFKLLNISSRLVLTDREIDLMASLCKLPYETALYFASKTKGPYPELKKLTGMSSSMISQYINRLKEKGLLTSDEDNIYHLPEPVNVVRRTVKKGMKEQGEFSFEYIFDLKVIDDTRSDRTDNVELS
jgi:biotin operon repressor